MAPTANATPVDSLYGTSNRSHPRTTPPAPPKRVHTSVVGGGGGQPTGNTGEGGVNIPLSASAFIQQQQQQQHHNQPMTLQATSFDSESSSASVQPHQVRAGGGPLQQPYSRAANVYSPDFGSPNDNKFTSV